MNYKGMLVDCAFRIDIFVDDILLLGLKAVERIDRDPSRPDDDLSRRPSVWLGLLMNFNSEVLRDSIRRVVLG